MAKQPAARFDRCLDFATALVHYGAGIPATDGPTALSTLPAPKSTKEGSEAGPQRRRCSMWWAAATAGGVVALLVAIDKPPDDDACAAAARRDHDRTTSDRDTTLGRQITRYQKGMKFVR
jgi:hypothetical protein